MASPVHPGSRADAEPSIRIGCAGLPQGLKRQRYFEQLRFLETDDTLFSLPRPSVLRRWRKAASETRPRTEGGWPEAGFSLVALGGITDPKGTVSPSAGADADPSPAGQAGYFRDTQPVRDTTATVAEAAKALQAEVVLFRTPAEFTPSGPNRDAMRHYFEELAAPEMFGGAARAWEPQGIWDPEETAQLCDELGLLYACDPLSRDPTTPDVDPVELLPSRDAYLRVTGLGRPRRRLDEHTLESLLLQAGRFERCWLVFATLDSRLDALACQKMLDAWT